MNESFFFSTFSLAFDIVIVLDFGHSNKDAIVSDCFNLHFSW